VSQLVHEHVLVALRRAAEARADSAAAAARAAAPPPAARPPSPDSAAPAPAAAPPAPQQPVRLSFVGRAQGADSTYLGLLGLLIPSHVVYAELADSLQFGVDYVLRIQGMPNLAGARAGVDTVRVSRGEAPAARPPARPPGGPRR
jgi:hypothetical protein